MARSHGFNSLSWGLTFFTNSIQNPSNTNLPATKFSIPPTLSPLYSPLTTSVLKLPAPHLRRVLFTIFFCFKHLWWRLQAVTSGVLSRFHFPPVSECLELLSQTWSRAFLSPALVWLYPVATQGWRWHLKCDLCGQRKQKKQQKKKGNKISQGRGAGYPSL